MSDAAVNKLASLKGLVGRVNEKSGGQSMKIGMHVQEVPRISTGSLSLDVALGGGVPIGRTTILYGEKSSGKTTTSYRIAGHAQRLCANCYRPAKNYRVEQAFDPKTGECLNDDDGNPMYVQQGSCDCYSKGLFQPVKHPEEKKDAYAKRIESYAVNSYEPFIIALMDMEGAFDAHWALSVGFDMRVIVYDSPNTAEEAIDAYDALIQTGSVDMLILDSVAALVPSKEIEASAADWQQGLQARLINKLVRKVQGSVNGVAAEYGKKVTNLWINQVRQKIGVTFGNNEVMPGGQGQGFISSVEIKLWASTYESEEVGSVSGSDKDMTVANKVRINFRVEKNKTAPPKGVGSYTMFLSSGQIDQSGTIVSLLEQFDELIKDGARWNLMGVSHATKGAAVATLREPAVFNRAMDILRSRMIRSRK